MRNVLKAGCLFGLLAFLWLNPAAIEAVDPEVLIPRVPEDQMAEARSWKNPYPATPENIEKGEAIFFGKGFCVTCHGKDGKGLNIEGLRGKLPRNFTDGEWQAARADGELLWILKNGSKGTAMAPFIPLVLTEDEAWHVLLYVRSLGEK